MACEKAPPGGPDAKWADFEAVVVHIFMESQFIGGKQVLPEVV